MMSDKYKLKWGCMKNRNTQISENFQGIGGPVISVGDLRYSALSPELPALEHNSQTLLQPCQEYLAGSWEEVYLRWKCPNDRYDEHLVVRYRFEHRRIRD